MTSTIVPPVDLAPGMPSRVVTISATDVTEGGQSLEGQTVRFALSDTLDVTTGGDVIAKTQAEVVLDADGNGSIRLPVYSESVKTWCGKDWAILVTATWGSQKAIRVPAGSGSVALSAMPPVRPLRGRELQWAITSVSVSVSTGASPGGTGTVSGGVLGLALTIPPMGDGVVLTTESLDTITATGAYRQPANAAATLARGYPVAGVGGTLWVELRSAGSTSQRWTPHGDTPFRQYIRWGTPTQWSAWEGVESTTVLNSNLGSADLNTVVIDGTYQQPANATATLARNYPVAGLGGTLQVRERSAGSVSQIWTPHGLAPYRMYFREGASGVFKDWEGVETSGSKVGPEIVDAHLDTFTRTGTYRQSQPGYPAQGNLGYPEGSGPGVLLVFTRTGSLAAQVYITVGVAQEEQMHYRVNTDTGWTTWRALGGSAGGSSSEPDLLAGYEAALGGL